MTQVTDAMVEAALDVMRGQDGGLEFRGGVDRVDSAIMRAALEAALSAAKEEAIERERDAYDAYLDRRLFQSP